MDNTDDRNKIKEIPVITTEVLDRLSEESAQCRSAYRGVVKKMWRISVKQRLTLSR